MIRFRQLSRRKKTPQIGEQRVGWALTALLLATFCGTLNSNIINAPIGIILQSLRVGVGRGVLVAIGFNLPFAALMPLGGWVGDRWGRRRVLAGALLLAAAGSAGATMSNSFALLVAFRAVQGLGSAAILPLVMLLINDMTGEGGRARALGLWAGSNGLARAVAVPLGGWLATVAGWHAIFWPLIGSSLASAALVRVAIPVRAVVAVPLRAASALTLVMAAALLMAAAAIAPITGLTSPATLAAFVASALGFAGFWRQIGRDPHPFLPPELLREPSYARSSIGVFAQMFCFSATLLAIPLFATRRAGMSVGGAGLVLFVVPAVAAVLATAAGRAVDRSGARRVLRAGLLGLAIGQAGLFGVVALEGVDGGVLIGALLAALLMTGVGVAFVQTPAATGAARSPAGRMSGGIGLFNLVRFAGAAFGAAWVALALSSGAHYVELFVGCTLVALIGLGGTWAGPGPSFAAVVGTAAVTPQES